MDKTSEMIRDLPDYEERMAQARRRASYEIGDPSWAGVILAAFLDPANDAAALAREQGEA
jgi:hypothetical protein